MIVREALGWLTPFGRALLVLGLVAVAAGLWLRWQEFLQVGAVVLALLVVAVAWVLVQGHPEVSLSVRPTRLVDGGRTGTVSLEVAAGGRPRLGGSVRVPVGDASSTVTLPALPPYGRAERSGELPPRPRGVYDVGPVLYERSDPLGLLRRPLQLGGTQRLLVRPRTADLEVFGGGVANLDGMVSGQLSMSDLAFHALREYVQGDDLRHVHWRSSAKTDQLQVRQYQESRRGQATVLLDHETSAYRGTADFELAVSVATTVALRAVRDELDTYLRCRDQLVVGHRPEGVLDGACAFTRDPSPFAPVAAAAAATIPMTGLVVLVTGPQRDRGELRAMASRFNRDASQVLVRCDPQAAGRVVDVRGIREVVVADLAQLRELLQRPAS